MVLPPVAVGGYRTFAECEVSNRSAPQEPGKHSNAYVSTQFAVRLKSNAHTRLNEPHELWR